MKKLPAPRLSLFFGFLFGFLGICRDLRAAAGDVDLSFDPGSGVNGTVRAVVLQPDGKLLMGGDFTTVRGLARRSVARLNADGSGDPTFDLGVSEGFTGVRSIALQPDGKVLVGHEYGIARLNADGSLDTSFHFHPILEFWYYTPAVSAIVVQPDGKVLAGGFFLTPHGYGCGIIRLNPDGSFDESFAVDASEYGGDTFVSSIALQPDGRVLVGGQLAFSNTGHYNIGIARLNPDGTLDTTFDPAGAIDSGSVTSMALQADGGVLLGGSFWTAGATGSTALARFHANGSLDTSFVHPLGNGSMSLVRAVVIQPDGKLLVGGGNGYTNTLKLARLNANGTLDGTFAQVSGGSHGDCNAIALQADGKVIVAEEMITPTGKSVFRMDAGGRLDSSFDTGSGLAEVASIAVQADGKILLGGARRLNADGSKDETYVPGTVNYDLWVPGATWIYRESSATQTDGKVLIGGYSQALEGWGGPNPYSYRYFLYRFNMDGSRDATFQPVLGPTTSYVQAIYSLQLQPDGKIVAGGNFYGINGFNREGIARLNADGSLDHSFVPARGAAVHAVLLQPGGEVVVGGYMRLFRLDASGALDATFASGAAFNNWVYALALQPDGKILIGGDFSHFNGVSRNGIARINAEGSLDMGFNTGSGVDGYVRAIAVQKDGNILIGGSFDTVKGVLRPNIARLLSTSNARPLVRITSPANGSVIPAPQSVAITAEASDEGAVTRVDFYAGSTFIASDSAAPYACAWADAPAGTHSLRVVAFDDLGASTSSQAVNITVTNAPPVVSISSPANGATFAAPASLTIAVNASDSDGSVVKVDFYGNGTFLGSDASAPFVGSLTQLPGGTYLLTAVATDNRGATTTSAGVNIVVTNIAPVVAITSPTAGSTFVTPAAITISANASDSDGIVTRVDFYSGGTWIGSDTSAPFGFTWSNVALGNYSLTARATDDAGAVTTSASVAISVVLPQPPAAPSNLTARVLSQTSILLSWTDNSANEVGFKIQRSSNGKTFSEVATVSGNVTSFTHSGLPKGAKYSYRVRAFNAGGDSAFSNTATAR